MHSNALLITSFLALCQGQQFLLAGTEYTSIDATNFTGKVAGFRFWEIVINNKQACDITNLAGVRVVQVDGIDPNLNDEGVIKHPTKVVERAPPFATQTQSLSELRRVSQPKIVTNRDKFRNYVFNGKAGAETYVYLVDDGINTLPIDLQGRVAPNPIVTGSKRQNENDLIDRSRNGHSTCAASKACGMRFGVAKSSTCVAVKTGRVIGDSAKAWSMILDDIVSRGIRKRAVINYSQSRTLPPSQSIPEHWLDAAEVMTELMNKDVPIVAAAGNHAKEPGHSQAIDVYPQAWSKDTFPIINVGGTTEDGQRNSFSQDGPTLALSAQGEGLTCSPGTGDGRPPSARFGTSYAAPQVAGMLAYFLSLDPPPFNTDDGKVSVNALNFLKNTASYPREDGGPNMAWNLITEVENPPTA
ncbi:hypothetical protein LTR95_006255 [Oleoguttula sp. CCFEE 5521]